MGIISLLYSISGSITVYSFSFSHRMRYIIASTINYAKCMPIKWSIHPRKSQFTIMFCALYTIVLYTKSPKNHFHFPALPIMTIGFFFSLSLSVLFNCTFWNRNKKIIRFSIFGIALQMIGLCEMKYKSPLNILFIIDKSLSTPSTVTKIPYLFIERIA